MHFISVIYPLWNEREEFQQIRGHGESRWIKLENCTWVLTQESILLIIWWRIAVSSTEVGHTGIVQCFMPLHCNRVSLWHVSWGGWRDPWCWLENRMPCRLLDLSGCILCTDVGIWSQKLILPWRQCHASLHKVEISRTRFSYCFFYCNRWIGRW